MAKERLQIFVEPEIAKILHEHAEALGMTTSQATAKIIEQAAPSLNELTSALRMAQKTPAKAIRHMAKTLQSSVEDADQMILDMEPKKAS